MKDYEFEVVFFKTVKASSVDKALDILIDKTKCINEKKHFTLLEEK